MALLFMHEQGSWGMLYTYQKLSSKTDKKNEGKHKKGSPEGDSKNRRSTRQGEKGLLEKLAYWYGAQRLPSCCRWELGMFAVIGGPPKKM